MTAGRVVSLTPSDFHVRGAVPLTVGVAAAGMSDTTVSTSVISGPLQDTDNPSISIDYSAKVASDLFVSRFSVEPGSYTVSTSVGSPSSSTFEELEVRVFDRQTYEATVASQGQLQTALYAVRDGTQAHAKITLQTGNYTWPADCKLDGRDVLVTFVGAGDPTFNFTEAPPIRWAKWLKCRFSNPTSAAFIANSGSHQVFDKCVFTNSVSGLVCRYDSYVRVEGGHISGVITGIIGAKIVRGLSWTKISGVVFQNCPVIEATFGWRNYSPPSVLQDATIVNKSTVWANYEGPQSGVAIRNNLVFSDYSTLIKFDTSISNLLMVGNVLNSSGSNPIQIKAITDSSILHNTVVHTGSGSSITIAGNTKGNTVANNWFSILDATVRRLAETAMFWTNNAYQSDFRFSGEDLVGVNPGWQNNYFWPAVSSPLRRGAVQIPSVKYLQGILASGQIGALPYHPDASLDHIYKSYRFDLANGLSLPAVVVS